MSEANAVVDSSGWIEVFTNGPLADRFIAVLDAEAALVVPDFQGINDVELLRSYPLLASAE